MANSLFEFDLIYVDHIRPLKEYFGGEIGEKTEQTEWHSIVISGKLCNVVER